MTDLTGTQSEYNSLEIRAANLRGGLLEQKEFIACTFIKCVFRETVFHGCEFRECLFRGCDLSLSSLKSSVFSGCLFEDCQLVGVNWTEAAWKKSRLLKPVDFSGCSINHSTFMGMDLKKIRIIRCSAREVDFTDANLSLADCTFSDFADSRFLHTDLSGADFTGATNYAIAANLNTLKKTKFSLPEAMSLLYGLDIELTEYQ
jgi:fluoroquinolone resistance protein